VQNIAVVGLDQLSQDFVRALGALADRGVRVIGVVDPQDGRAADRLTAEGLRVMSLEEMVALGEGVDIVFDLAGDPELRRRLRQALFASESTISPQRGQVQGGAAWSSRKRASYSATTARAAS